MNHCRATEVERELLLEQAARALASEFVQRQLPRTQAILAEIAETRALADDDAAFLADMLATLACAGELFERHPEIEALHRCALALHDDIMTEAFAKGLPRRAAAGG